MTLYPVIPATYEYRLAVGHITKAAIEANSAYLLTNFPVQFDQHSINQIPWGPPEDGKTLYPARQRYGQYADQSQWSDGSWVFQWSLTYLTEMMAFYLEDLIWPGGIESNIVTVKTLKHRGTFGVYQCTANKIRPPATDFARGYQGIEFVQLRFVKGIEIF